MKRFLPFALLFSLGAIALQAQDRTERTTVIVSEDLKQDYFSIRFGAWFPRDVEKTFTQQSAENIPQTIDQSQAIGLDFHYRYEIGWPLLFDFSIGGWYSTYAFKALETLSSPSLVQEADAWVAIAPITAGLSVNPLPKGNPLQPYATAGIGAYVGVSGTSDVIVGRPGTHSDDKTLVAFGGYAGVGLAFMLTRGFGLDIGVKYQFVSFKEEMFTKQKDFTGLQILAGITTRL